MNRHYMKVAAPGRIAAESMRYFLGRGYVRKRTDAALEYVSSLLPMAVGSVDRLEEIPERVQFVFEFDAAVSLLQPDVRARGRGDRRAAGDSPPCPTRSRGRCSTGTRSAPSPRACASAPAEGQGVVPPDSRRADRIGRRPRARPGGAGHRPRRRAASVGVGGEDRQL
jgi:hypothetical protein